MTLHTQLRSQIKKGLIIREPWISLILDHGKRWELRGTQTAHRGVTALIASGTGKLYGKADLVQVFGPLSNDVLFTTEALHQVPSDMLLGNLRYRTVFAWVFENPERFEFPIPYEHPHGAVTWINLEGVWK